MFTLILVHLERYKYQLLKVIRIICLISQGSGDSTGMIKAPVTKCDSGTQTDTHFMESHIVKSYEWNEWELRRKAIKLVQCIIH